MSVADTIRSTLREGGGIFRMAPTWVPRSFNRPGKRLRLHPDDYYALGLERGAIAERWFSSITRANNQGAPEDEGLSYALTGDNDKILFRNAVRELGAELIGEKLMADYGAWPMYAKFYDYQHALFHHVHHGEEASRRVGQLPKHEHYFFPTQYNNHLGDCPVTYFGFDPSVGREEIRRRLAKFETADGRITELSRAFRLQLGTGWYTPAGVLHAPGSLLTYEPQWNSDVLASWENVVSGEPMGREYLYNFLPEELKDDLQAVMDVPDWEINTCADYRERYFHPPVPEQRGDGWNQNWIVYGNPYIGGKELTVQPGRSVTIRDNAAHGAVVVQGHGSFGAFDCESPTLIRFGQLTADEFYVSKPGAEGGVRVINRSKVEPLVILKHFGPDCGMDEVDKKNAILE